MIELGFKPKTVKLANVEVDSLNGVAAMTLLAITTRTRGMQFSKGAIAAMNLLQPVNGLQDTPKFTNTKISIAHDVENSNFFIFVNNGDVETEMFDVSEGTLGWRNKPFYEVLAKEFNLDTTKENHILLEAYPQDIYNVQMFKFSEVLVPFVNEVVNA